MFKNRNYGDDKQLRRLERVMGQLHDDIVALIPAIQQGRGTDQATKDSVEQLMARVDILISKDAESDEIHAELTAVIRELAYALANAPPTPPTP